MAEGSLEVLLIGAFNLHNADFLGKLDPYALVSYGNQKERSSIAADHGTHPSWNQKFTFFSSGEERTNELLVQIYDADRFSKDDLIGSAKVTLDEAFAGRAAKPIAYTLVRPNGKTQGEVKLSITFTPKRVL